MKLISSVSTILLSSLLANADVYKVSGFTFDDANAVRKATIVEGPLHLRDFSSRTFGRYNDSYVNIPGDKVNLHRDFDHSKSIGRLLGRRSSGFSRHVSLPQADDTLPAANVHRSTIELNWVDHGLPNKSGADLVIYEAGQWEGFVVSVRKAGSSEFSAPRYQFVSAVDKRLEINAVAFDLTNFGVADGEVIAAIRIRNIFGPQARSGADKVDNESGQGKVLYPSDPNYEKGFPLRMIDKGPEFKPKRLGADLIYAVGLHDIVSLKPDGIQASK